jgi:hypothetical protein
VQFGKNKSLVRLLLEVRFMKRYVLAVAALVGGSLAVARAEYIRISYNLGPSKAQPTQVANGGLDPEGGVGPGGGRGGGFPGFPGSGRGGAPGGGGFPGGMGRPGGGGAMGPGGAGGALGPGGRGGAPGGGFPGGGFPGGMGRPGGGGAMGPGGAGGALGPGGRGGFPGFPGGGGQDLSSLLQEEDDGWLRAEAVVEYYKSGTVRYRGENLQPSHPFPTIYHKWGRTALAEFSDIKFTFIQLPPVKARYKFKREELLRGVKPEDKPEKLLELARWALGHSLLTEYTEVMDELAKVKKDDPAVIAYQAVQKDLERRPPADPAARDLKDRLGSAYKIRESAHYTLLYNTPGSDSPQAALYLKLMEDNFRGYFYWFALRGRALVMPERRLTAVLVEKPEEFLVHRRVYDNAPLIADGFCARRELLAFYSAKRLDEAYDALQKGTKDLWQSGWNLDDLLNAKGHAKATPDEIVKNEMLALLLKAMQQESALASVSQVGSIQLASATGPAPGVAFLPRNVEVPRWLQAGVGSFFGTPKGAYWPGIGAPNWQYMVKFKMWENGKTLDPAAAALRSVVTDRYFLQAAGPAGNPAEVKADTMAWALVYFLAESKPGALISLCDELNRMPRDLAFDPDSLLACFGRALDLVDPTDPNAVNSVKTSKLADEWYSFLHYTNLEAAEAYNDAVNAIKEAGKKKSRRTGGGGK